MSKLREIKNFLVYLWHLLFGEECRYSKECLFFKRRNITCMSGGGNYCGKFRGFKKMEKNLENNLNQGSTNSIPDPNLFLEVE